MRKKIIITITILLFLLLAISVFVFVFFLGYQPWSTQYVDIHTGMPRLAGIITKNFTDLERIVQVSKFRSGQGHNFSDSFETCRSMKHYFKAEGTDIEIIAPLDGQVVLMLPEAQGYQIWVKSSHFSNVFVVISHVQPEEGVTWFTPVLSGQKIGTHSNIEDIPDITIEVFGPPTQHRLVSYFDLMTDEVFSAYQEKFGVSSRAEFLISQGQRDANPLNCVGSQFSTNDPADWVGELELDNQFELDDEFTQFTF